MLFLAVAVSIVFVFGARAWCDPPYIFGIHDPGGEYLMEEKGKTGWVLVTEEIGHNPNDMSGGNYSSIESHGHGVIVRLNNGYGSTGTIPLPQYYDEFAIRCGNFVQASGGCHIWIIGNETNLACEWPDGQPIYPSDYISCFLQCRSNIRSRPGHESDNVIPAAIGTYCASNPAACVGDWIEYFTTVLEGVEGQCDGIAIHTYTHGTDPDLIFSDAKMDWPYDDRYYNFRAYLNYMESIPSSMRNLPAYITETDQIDPWEDVNSGWVQNAYLEINNWNTTPGNQKIRSVCLYRWQPWDQWCWQYKEGVKDDFRDAMDNDYRWALESDLYTDGIVNFLDFAVLADHWLQDNHADIAPPPSGDGVVDFLDLAKLTEQWLKSNSQ